MKQMMIALTFLTLTFSSAFAADLTTCNGKYLVSVFKESKDQVNSIIFEAHLRGFLDVTTYNEKVGPYTVYGLDAGSQAAEGLRVMNKIKVIPGAIVECDSELSLN